VRDLVGVPFGDGLRGEEIGHERGWREGTKKAPRKYSADRAAPTTGMQPGRRGLRSNRNFAPSGPYSAGPRCFRYPLTVDFHVSHPPAYTPFSFPTMANDTEARVTSIIVEKLGVDESDITRDASFQNDLGADSLDTVELIMEFEKEFDMTIPDEDAEKIATVGDAVDYVEANRTA